MDNFFIGKRALVTGAAQGIGKGIATELIKYGANVVALDKSPENLAKLKQEVPNIITVEADLRNWEQTKKVIQSFLPIDLLVNNAGVATLEPITEVTEKQFDSVFDVNIKAMFNVTQEVVSNLLERKAPGAIVNISSQLSKAGSIYQSLYCSSKSAVDGLTRALAIELGSSNIRVNSVNPTVVLTEMGSKMWADPDRRATMISRIPLNRFAEIHNVVDAVIFLLSDKASMITGSSLPIDGGFLAS